MLPNREIDLVIQNENMMMQFIKLLVFKMNTIDGNKDSAKNIKRALLRQMKSEFKQKNNKKPN